MSAPAETLSRLHRLTVADYHRMGEAGLFTPGARTELIEGAIIDRTPIGPNHAGVVTQLNQELSLAVGRKLVVAVQNPLHLGHWSEPEPDLVLLHPRGNYYRTRHPRPADVLLVVEVADTTVAFDRHTKLPLYARHGVPEAWLVDLPAGVLEIHREPGEEGYTRVEHLGPGDLAAVPLPGLAGTTVDLTGLL